MKENGVIHPVKEYVKNVLNEKLQNFELINGGQQRTVGDLIEDKVCEILHGTTNELISETRVARGKKSIEDVTLISESITYYVDPKTHNVKSEFSMPNLTAIEKLKKLFLNNNEDLIYVIVDYNISDKIVIIEDIKVFFIWELDCSILGVGALGNGQLQIKNANKTLIFTNKGKSEWYLDFKLIVQEFLKKQINKVNKQMLEWV